MLVRGFPCCFLQIKIGLMAASARLRLLRERKAAECSFACAALTASGAARGLIREQVESDDGQEAGGGHGGEGDDERGPMGADDGDGLIGAAAQGCVLTPTAQEREAAGGENHERHGDEEEPETDAGARGIPGDDARGAAGGLVLLRLEIAHEERSHEESRGEDKREFHGGESAAEWLHAVVVARMVARGKDFLGRRRDYYGGVNV